ncbi:MFS transporter [Amycolatopsis sp. OK19-0408]|uniref:MFS transporter n=1 Tax=Amycolatopsis iheyensis TaxID=2945988 RepID=A0A9X2NNP2_9PSEU|nr:MFS transporter [Amycolatopsis iheyensis]MCR6488460.1 MFS transporter [Amycolatopsis iheyensis]
MPESPAPGGRTAAPSTRGTATARLLPSLAVNTLVLFATYSGLIGVLLPNQVAALDPVHKVANLSLVTTVSFVFTLFAQPIAGALSDRTRSGLGRRAPWLLGGAAAGAGFLLGLGGLRELWWIAVFWVLVQVALNVLQGPLSAVVADRFPRQRRGMASAMVGIGTMAGVSGGVLLAGQVAGRVGTGYTVFAVAVLAVTGVFVLLNPDAPTRDAAREPFSWREFLAGFWVDPRRHPDFAWAFAGRFLFILGYFVVYGFQLYILTDYVHLPLATANRTIGLLSLASLATTLVSIPLSGWLSDRLGRRKIFVYFASVTLAAGLLVPLVAPTVTGMVVSGVIQGLGYGAYLACDTALMTEVLPGGGAAAGKDLGILNIATNIPQAASPAVAGLLITTLGGYPALFLFAAVVVLLASLAIVPIRTVR